MERKRDLDTTKEKMDKLVEKLYLGRSVASLLAKLIKPAFRCPMVPQRRLHKQAVCTGGILK